MRNVISLAIVLVLISLGSAIAVEIKVDWDPDAYTHLALKFKVSEIVIRLSNAEAELAHGQALPLNPTSLLSDGTQIEGSDCLILVGNVTKLIEATRADTNKDGYIADADFLDVKSTWYECVDLPVGPAEAL
ncbi:MAG: hypothetical protein ACYTEQ_23005 [Planctomycetota bacterium]